MQFFIIRTVSINKLSFHCFFFKLDLKKLRNKDTNAMIYRIMNTNLYIYLKKGKCTNQCILLYLNSCK